MPALTVSHTNDPAHVALTAVHRLASLFMRWLLGTHQGGVAQQHLDYYLDEFVFRFNRRKSKARELAFAQLSICSTFQSRPLGPQGLVSDALVSDAPSARGRGPRGLRVGATRSTECEPNQLPSRPPV